MQTGLPAYTSAETGGPNLHAALAPRGSRRRRAVAGGVLRPLLSGVLVASLAVMLAAVASPAALRFVGYGTWVAGRDAGEAFPAGSLVLSRSIAAAELEAGDVMLVRSAGQPRSKEPTLYYAVSLEGTGSTTLLWARQEGRGSVERDPFVLPDRVVIAAHAVPYVGYLVGLVRSPLGFVLLAALPAGALCLLLLRRIWAPRSGSPQPDLIAWDAGDGSGWGLGGLPPKRQP